MTFLKKKKDCHYWRILYWISGRNYSTSAFNDSFRKWNCLIIVYSWELKDKARFFWFQNKASDKFESSKRLHDFLKEMIKTVSDFFSIFQLYNIYDFNSALHINILIIDSSFLWTFHETSWIICVLYIICQCISYSLYTTYGYT